MPFLDLSVFGCYIRIESLDERASSLLAGVYRSSIHTIKHPQILYRVGRESVSHRVYFAQNGMPDQVTRDHGDFVSKFDKDLVIEIQKLRPDLYFVHAAVFVLHGSAIALVAPSGFGKSTTTWGLLHHDFDYLSDELAPIDVSTLRVHPFPRALCLKTNPPSTYPLPASAIGTCRAFYVPTCLFPGQTITDSLPLDAIFFLRFISENTQPRLTPVSAADATVRLFTNTLNLLAHTEYGIDRAIAIVSKARCFELLTGDLGRTCELMRTFLAPHSGNITDAGCDVS